MKISLDQAKALRKIFRWYNKQRHSVLFITLGGYAGTGKTTLIAVMRQKFLKKNAKLRIGFVCYTGKAARVLKTKLKQEHAIHKGDSVSTIHSLIYSPVINEKEEIIGWKKKEKIDFDIIIIDEASMVNAVIWKHVLGYKKPIIVVGDHGQLPPIEGMFSLMKNPDVTIETIHRQAKHNPIIDVSIMARNDGAIPPGVYGKNVVKFNSNDPEAKERVEELLHVVDNETLVLCGYNHTRKRLNSYIRSIKDFHSQFPISGDRVICLRNNYQKNIFNGMLGTVMECSSYDEDWLEAEILMDDEEVPFVGLVSKLQFQSNTALNFTKDRKTVMRGDLFDFGYALTVHKAQGSQAKRVILFEERFKKMTDDDWKRWLYTGVTRAEEELFIFANY